MEVYLLAGAVVGLLARFWLAGAAGLAPVVTPGVALGCGVTSPGEVAGGEVWAVVRGGCALFCGGEAGAAFWAVGAVPA